MDAHNPETPDVEESAEERAARVIDAASQRYAERCDQFATRLRNNGRSLSPYKRKLVGAWLKRHHDRLLATLDDGEGIPPLGLDGLPDYE